MARNPGTPKTGGRKKGTPNKTSAEIKTVVVDFVGEFFIDNLKTKEFKKKFKDLDFDVQFTMVTKLIPYVLSKQTDTKISLDEESLKAVKEASDKINDIFK